MSELTLFLIRFAYLAILWIFVLSAISVIRSDMFGARVARRRPPRRRRRQARQAARPSRPSARGVAHPGRGHRGQQRRASPSRWPRRRS